MYLNNFMPTAKKRISITLDRETDEILEEISNFENVPASKKVLEFFKIGLSLEEDKYLSILSEKRLKDNKKFISHQEAWK